MSLQFKPDLINIDVKTNNKYQLNDQVFSKDYVDFLNQAGWRLEKKFPSNSSQYSDLLEDTDWKYNSSDLECYKHYRRDLDALS
tara:strand:- start:2046 stop:2297 length:252 start_codon:yes stop_codon:yes gene_type:complete